MFLGKLLLVAVLVLKFSVTCRGVTNGSEDMAANFNAATVPGWLGKLDNPLVLSAFPDAARVAFATDLQGNGNGNGVGNGGCPQGPPCGKAIGNKHVVSARLWPTPARSVLLSRLLCVLCPSVHEGFLWGSSVPRDCLLCITAVATHALKPGFSVPQTSDAFSPNTTIPNVDDPAGSVVSDIGTAIKTVNPPPAQNVAAVAAGPIPVMVRPPPQGSPCVVTREASLYLLDTCQSIALGIACMCAYIWLP